MARRSDPATRLRTPWSKALAVAKTLFEAEGYPTRSLQELEAFLCQQPVPGTTTLPAREEACTGGALRREPDIPCPDDDPGAPPAGRYRIDHYPHSRYWAVYDQERLIAVTVYKRGAREVVGRLEMHERAIAALKRQLGQLPSLG